MTLHRRMTQIIERPPSYGDDSQEPPIFTPVPTATNLTMAQAINRALHDAMAADDRVLVFGEDVAKLGGVFRVTEGLTETFGDGRCFDTPLAESAIIGIAIGLAIRGFVPVPEIQFDGFSYPAFDQIVSHLAKYRMRTHGDVDMPVTVRIPSFGGIGAVEHHSESTETYWAHTAGLKVVVPSTPSDAYWLLRHSIASRDPVIYLEPKRRYWSREDVDTSEPGLPIGRAAIRRIGDDVTVLTYGGLVQTALAAADLAADQYGWNLEVVDLRSLNPLDFDTVAASVRKTGRAVVIHEGARTLGFGAELAARIQEELFLRPGGAGVARHRIRHAVPAGAAGEALAARCRPAARLRREGDALMTTRRRARVRIVAQRGPERAGGEDSPRCRTSSFPTSARAWRTPRSRVACRGRRRRRAQPDAVHRGDQQGRGRDTQPYAGRIAELGGAEGDTLPSVGAGAHRDRWAGSRFTDRGGPTRKPVLVGYGADDAMDTAGGPLEAVHVPGPSRRCASWPPNSRSTWPRWRRVRARRHRHPR